MTMKSKLLLIIIVVIIALLTKFLYSTTYTDFTLKGPSGTQQISIPHSGKFGSPQNNEFTVEGYISVGVLSSNIFRIIPDDKVISITINKLPVDLSHIPASELSSWNKGFKIDLRPYFTQEKNHIRIELMDTGGQYSILINNSVTGIAQVPYWLILSLCMTIGIYTIAKACRLRKELCIAVTTGVLLRWFYVLITGFDTRGHDTWEHIEYIMHFTKEWALPDLSAAVDGAYFHPPLYYWLNSIIFEISQWFSPNDKAYGYKWLQYASFTYSIGFLLFTGKLIELFFQEINTKNPHFRSRNQSQRFFDITSPRLHSFFAMLCISVWPGAILHSSRIGNDPQLYFLFIASSYYIYKFYLTPKFHFFLLGVVFTALAVTTKANAAVLGLAGAGVVLYHWWNAGFTFPKKAIAVGILPSILLLGAAGLTFYPGIALKLKGDRTHLYIDNINNVSKGLQVGNEAKNYLWVDINTFINEPFTSPWDDKLGRQYFANYLGKTSLFGEWRFDGGLARNCAMIMSFIFLAMMVISVYSVYSINVNHLGAILPIVALHLLLVAPIYYMRMTFPVNIDFRYIIPSLASLMIIFNYGLWKASINGHTRFAKLGLTLQSIFVFSSVGFISHFALS
ncbi:ArnT family glycosyltransferase [Marinagarivorans cellulosilyticus]|uniref:Glycosyltransferase RgtA/B/C/D-like domain-containing protein n=1 Tax=Marinagarivorans cellulosilyticus TaxID=2721545 RepID=A0AAN2BJJ8_9GAMM|nr:hypothetical protein [Marinagarivorans cellulosilyticus]BCD97068.1 hypothetical protein MARGE09_P1268 [Marinagarivorans cellulosilyticus]